MFRLGRRRALLISVSFSGVLGVAVCFSNSSVVFQLLRLGQGTALAGVFLSSYITREFHMSVRYVKTHTVVYIGRSNISFPAEGSVSNLDDHCM